MSVELGSEIAVHVPTQEDYDWLMKYLDDKGITWVSGEPTWEGNEWEKYSNTTSINFKEERGISFSPYSFYKKYGYEIITLDEYKRREGLMEFSKKDLKAGMLVECRNGDMGILMPTTHNEELNVCRYNQWGISNLEDYDDDLIFTTYKDDGYDIMKVYGYTSIKKPLVVEIGDRELLWERKEDIKEYTMEESQEKLGEEFKLIK